MVEDMKPVRLQSKAQQGDDEQGRNLHEQPKYQEDSSRDLEPRDCRRHISCWQPELRRKEAEVVARDDKEEPGKNPKDQRDEGAEPREPRYQPLESSPLLLVGAQELDPHKYEQPDEKEQGEEVGLREVAGGLPG